MESITVRVDDYLPLSVTFRLEDSLEVSVHEEEKTINSPKDAPLSNDEENDPVSKGIRANPKTKHLVTTDVRTIEDELQQ